MLNLSKSSDRIIALKVGISEFQIGKMYNKQINGENIPRFIKIKVIEGKDKVILIPKGVEDIERKEEEYKKRKEKHEKRTKIRREKEIKKVKKRGFKDVAEYERWIRKATVEERIDQYKKDVIRRFWEKVDKKGEDECWNWLGAISSSGCGTFIYGKIELAHRVSYILSNYDIPDGLNVLHKCDNKKCVNPKHLFLGNQSDNMKDMFIKGRKNHIGENNPRCKLTQGDIYDIRKKYMNGESQRHISNDYGILVPQVSRIVRNKSWYDKDYQKLLDDLRMKNNKKSEE